MKKKKEMFTMWLVYRLRPEGWHSGMLANIFLKLKAPSNSVSEFKY